MSIFRLFERSKCAVVYNEWMKSVIVLVVIGLAMVGVYQFFQEPSSASKEEQANRVSMLSPVPVTQKSKRAVKKNNTLFVPYWNPSVDAETKENYDTFVYFGVAIDQEGEILQDSGLAGIDVFVESTQGKKQYLTLRMIDTDTNNVILEDTVKQKRIFEGIIPLLQQYEFDGLVLDLEMSAIPLTDLRNNISLFIQRFGDALQEADTRFAVTLYGDVYYRARPYDVKLIGTQVDEIMVMAYDYHKARGEAGPNFPFTGKSHYGYDFQEMIADYLTDVPPEKLTILFGMYGYDWTLGSQGKPLKAAKARALTDIQDMIQPSCGLINCQIIRDEKTEEAKVIYKDDEGYGHELWFEDEQSAQVKIEFLDEAGIGSVGYWVYGYF